MTMTMRKQRNVFVITCYF